MKLPFGFSLEADFNGDGFLFLFLLIVGSIFVFLMNRPTRNAQSRSIFWFSWVFPLSRSFALLLLLLLLFAPQISLLRQYSIPKRLAVIVDESRSMGKAWEGDVEKLQSSISQTITQLEENHAVDVWSMDGHKISADGFIFDNELSVFDWNPGKIDAQAGGELYSEAFLLSDGHLNGGRSPLDMEWSKLLPVNVVLPLKPKSNAFLKLLDVSYLSDINDSESLIIRGKIHQSGLIGRRATVQVFSEYDQLLGEEIISITQGYQDLNIPVRMGNSGITRVKVALFLEGRNFLTERVLEIEQIKKQPIILVVSERINELHKFLIQSFPDSAFQVHIIQGTQGPGYKKNATEIPKKLDLILLNQPGEMVHQALLQAKIDLETLPNTPLILFHNGNEGLNPAWSELLGVGSSQENDLNGIQTSFWSESARDHAFYLGLLGQGYKPSDLMEYAPVITAGHRPQVGGVDLMLTGFGASKHSILSLSDNPPRAIFSGSGFWKWFFHPQSKPSFEILWKYLLVYLQEIADFKPVQLKILSSSAPIGAYVTGDVLIRDFDNRNIRAVELRVWQEDEAGEKTVLTPSRDQAGVYQTQLDTKLPGEKLVVAEAYRFGELWGRDTSRIQVMSFNGEDQSRGVDEVFLARLASRSGGQIIELMKDDLPKIPVEIVKRESSFLYRGVRSPLLFGGIILLLTLEWIWRRRSGLL